MNEEPIMVDDFLRRVDLGEENILTVIRELSPEKDGKQVRLVIEGKKKEPIRQESKRRNHSFHTLAGFKDYLGKYATENTVVFANVPAMVVSAVIDEAAEKGVEQIELKPQIHPRFQPWHELIEGGTYVPVDKFAEFVLTHRKGIKSPEGLSLSLAFQQVLASQKTEIQQGSGRTAVNGIVCTTTIQGESQGTPVELPEVIKLEMSLFVGTDPVVIDVDVLLVLRNHEVSVKLTSADITDEKLKLFDVWQAELDGIDKVLVTSGSPCRGSWNYI